MESECATCTGTASAWHPIVGAIPCPACLGSGSGSDALAVRARKIIQAAISMDTQARLDAFADADTLRNVMRPKPHWLRILWTEDWHGVESWGQETVKACGRYSAQAAFRAVPGLRE